MAGPKELSGIVLSRDPAGDRFLRICIFDQTTGLTTALFSLRGRTSTIPSFPDLFDDIECILKPTKTDSSIPFVRDFQKLHSHRELANKPKVFFIASEIARFFVRNGAHLLDPAPHLKLLRLSLGSFCRAPTPQVVQLKLYYCFSRDEGLPVRESWLATLPRDLAKITIMTLKLPVDKAIVEESKLNEILERLKIWMNSETELCVE